MDFAEVVRRRRMVRRYDPYRPLPPGLLDRLIDIALRAPSAGFSQGVAFLLLESAEDRDRFWAATGGPGEPDSWLRGMRAAPGLILLLCAETAYRERYAQPDKQRGHRSADWSAPYWFVDAGMAAMAVLYAVVDADPDSGLGACFFGVPNSRTGELGDAFDLPAERTVAGVISVGYRAGDERPSGSPRRRGRRPRAELVHHGRWQD